MTGHMKGERHCSGLFHFYFLKIWFESIKLVSLATNGLWPVIRKDMAKSGSGDPWQAGRQSPPCLSFLANHQGRLPPQDKLKAYACMTWLLLTPPAPPIPVFPHRPSTPVTSNSMLSRAGQTCSDPCVFADAVSSAGMRTLQGCPPRNHHTGLQAAAQTSSWNWHSLHCAFPKSIKAIIIYSVLSYPCRSVCPSRQ